MTPTDEQCDAIVREAWGLSPDSTSITPQDRTAIRAAFAAGAASVAVPRGKHSKECRVNGGLYCMCAAPAAQDQQEKKRLAAIEFANPCQCAACVAARDKMDAMCAPAPARQEDEK